MTEKEYEETNQNSEKCFICIPENLSHAKSQKLAESGQRWRSKVEVKGWFRPFYFSKFGTRSSVPCMQNRDQSVDWILKWNFGSNLFADADGIQEIRHFFDRVPAWSIGGVWNFLTKI